MCKQLDCNDQDKIWYPVADEDRDEFMIEYEAMYRPKAIARFQKETEKLGIMAISITDLKLAIRALDQWSNKKVVIQAVGGIAFLMSAPNQGLLSRIDKIADIMGIPRNWIIIYDDLTPDRDIFLMKRLRDIWFDYVHGDDERFPLQHIELHISDREEFYRA
jgi:hypothetical protein